LNASDRVSICDSMIAIGSLFAPNIFFDGFLPLCRSIFRPAGRKIDLHKK
jgi:hypothetical protein